MDIYTAMTGVVSVKESKVRKPYSLHTTRSWGFMDLNKPLINPFDHKVDDLLTRAKYGQDVIVGILDTGMYLPP